MSLCRMSPTPSGNDNGSVEALDEAARHYLNMSAEEFLRQWKAGHFRGRRACSDPRIAYVASLIPDSMR